MEAIKISLSDYILSGGGANGESFDHKSDRFDRRGGKPQYKSSENRGGHERFDRSGGKRKK